MKSWMASELHWKSWRTGFALAALALVMASGCDSTSCVRNSDCKSAEQCVLGTCTLVVTDASMMDGASASPDAGDGAALDASVDASGGDAASKTPVDAAATDAAAADGAAPAEDAAGASDASAPMDGARGDAALMDSAIPDA